MHYSERVHLRLYGRNLKVEEMGKFIRRYSGLSSEETKNSSELSFHSSEVSFDTSEDFFLSSVGIFDFLGRCRTSRRCMSIDSAMKPGSILIS